MAPHDQVALPTPATGVSARVPWPISKMTVVVSLAGADTSASKGIVQLAPCGKVTILDWLGVAGMISVVVVVNPCVVTEVSNVTAEVAEVGGVAVTKREALPMPVHFMPVGVGSHVQSDARASGVTARVPALSSKVTVDTAAESPVTTATNAVSHATPEGKTTATGGAGAGTGGIVTVVVVD